MNGHVTEDDSPRKKSRRKREKHLSGYPDDGNNVDSMVNNSTPSPPRRRQLGHSKSSYAVTQARQYDDVHDVNSSDGSATTSPISRRQLERRSQSTSVLTVKHQYRDDVIKKHAVTDAAFLTGRRHHHKSSSALIRNDQYDDNHNVKNHVQSSSSTPTTRRHRHKRSSDNYNDDNDDNVAANAISRHRNKNSLTSKRQNEDAQDDNNVDNVVPNPTSRRHRSANSLTSKIRDEHAHVVGNSVGVADAGTCSSESRRHQNRNSLTSNRHDRDAHNVYNGVGVIDAGAASSNSRRHGNKSGNERHDEDVGVVDADTCTSNSRRHGNKSGNKRHDEDVGVADAGTCSSNSRRHGNKGGNKSTSAHVVGNDVGVADADTGSSNSRRHVTKGGNKSTSALTRKYAHEDAHDVGNDVGVADADTGSSNSRRHVNKSGNKSTSAHVVGNDVGVADADTGSSNSRRHVTKGGNKSTSALTRKYSSLNELGGFLSSSEIKVKARPLVDATSLAAGKLQDDSRPATSSPTLPMSLRNVVYYQHRFIVLDSPASKTNVHSSRGSLSADGHRRRSKRTGNRALRMRDGATECVADDSFGDRGKRVLCQADDQKTSHGNKRAMDMDATSVTMDSRGIVPEIVVSDSDGIRYTTQNKKQSVVKRITGILMDNRMKGRRDCEVVLRDHPEQYRVLKKVLNIVIVTIGFALLLSVCIVIAYTAIVPTKSDPTIHTVNIGQEETNTPKIDAINHTTLAENWENKF